MSANHKIAVVGVGNILFTDEGIGVYASKFLEANYDFAEGVDIIDGGVLGFRLMPFFQDYDCVVLLDTVSINDEAGSVYKLPKDALLGLGSYRQTAHEVEVVEMLEICTFLDKCADTTIIGIVPSDIESVAIELTPILLDSFDAFIKLTLEHLTSLGVQYSEKPTQQTLGEVLDFFANQSTVTC